MARLSVASCTLVLVALAACGDATGVNAPDRPTAAPPSLATASVATSSYIVTFKPGVGSGAGRAAEKVASGGHLTHTYSRLLNGFSAELSEAAVRVLRLDPEIESVVPDPALTLSATQTGATWGLDRLDQTSLPLSGTYTYANDGGGVTVYIVDTGINTAHVDFGGRAVPGYDAVTAGGTAADCHGHGTHVAGTVGGTKYGVAKGVRLVAVRVLDCGGNGTGSGLLAGLDWIAQQKAASPATPMVVNMSLGGSASQVLDDAVQALVERGVVAAVAAGNAGIDACTTSPARAPGAITVGATDKTDNLASWSNRGPCVDLEAPGVAISSDSYSSTTGAASMSGTSMASPHVAGAAALYLKANPAATPAQVSAALVANAVAKIVAVPANTVNKLLNVAFLSAGAPPPPPATIAVSPTSATLAIGATSALAATTANAPVGGTFAWVSRNAAVATVTASGATGTAAAAGPGAVYVVSTYTAGTTVVRDSALITVLAPSVAVSPATPSILVGAQTALSASVSNPGTSGAVSWASRNPAVATVASTGTSTASATGVAAGSAYVVASYVTGGTTVRDSALVTVTAPAPPPPPASGAAVLASATGKGCITINSADVTRSVYTVLAACQSGAPRQTYTVPATGATGQLALVANGAMCLTGYSNAAPGTVVGTNPCSATAATQRWTLNDAGELKLPNGYCAAATTLSWGIAVRMAVCNGSPEQRWIRQ